MWAVASEDCLGCRGRAREGEDRLNRAVHEGSATMPADKAAASAAAVRGVVSHRRFGFLHELRLWVRGAASGRSTGHRRADLPRAGAMPRAREREREATAIAHPVSYKIRHGSVQRQRGRRGHRERTRSVRRVRRIAVSAVRERIADVLGHVALRRERIVLTRHGRELGAPSCRWRILSACGSWSRDGAGAIVELPTVRAGDG